MKIGIITYQFAHNLGAALQCYCLQESLIREGHAVEIINYCPQKLTRYYKVVSNPVEYGYYRYLNLRNKNVSPNRAKIKALLSAAKAIKQNVHIPYRYKRKKAFEKFSSRFFRLTQKYTSFEELQKECTHYDMIFCGSDQIWNTRLLDDTFDPAYFLKFANKKQRKIAYAPSFGETDPRIFAEQLTKLLSDFFYVSVREQQDVIKLESVLKRKVNCVLDPVFLVDRDKLNSVADCVPREKESYILIYALADDMKFYEICKNLDDNCKIIDISPIKIQWHHKNVKKKIRKIVGPDEFLSLIRGAKHVITNSFHGTAFSIIFNKDLYVVPLKCRNERLENVMKIAELESRFVYDSNLQKIEHIDYAKVNQLISEERMKSLGYLQASLYDKEPEELWSPAEKMSISNELRNGDDCCGCGACASVCNINAIRMTANEEGFLVPIIDQNKCVHCDRCLDACNTANNFLDKDGAIKYYAYQNLKEVRMRSASGGAWSMLAKQCVKEQGSAFGAVWTRDFLGVQHKAAINLEQIKEQCGSKYIEGHTVESYHTVGELLKSGKMVLFSGTPCQCNALKTYLSINKVNQKNLILVDLICHGLSSPRIWNSYVKYIEQLYRGKIVGFTFRDKLQSWSGIHEKIWMEDGSVLYLTPEVHTIGKIMETEAILRPSCYQCKYSSMNRVGDITIGDFWGIEKIMPELDTQLGTSVLFANTSKGLAYIRKINEYDSVLREFDELEVKQPNLIAPTQRPAGRENFWEDYHKCNENDFISSYSECGKKKLMKLAVKRFLYKIKNG